MMTLIEPKAFESISLGNRKVDGAQVTSSYADHWASHLVLNRALKSFGVSKYQLARLLGVPQESASKYMNFWLSARCRPSQLYMTRLVWLNFMVFEDFIKPSKISAIDWNTGEITMRKNQGFAVSKVWKPNEYSKPLF